MNVHKQAIDGVLLFDLSEYEDERGSFLELYSEHRYQEIGLPEFVQDNLSYSHQGVLRGMHFQTAPHAQGKLVSLLSGSIQDVVVDIRKDSPTYGQWVSFVLTTNKKQQVWVAPGLAHGFLALADNTVVTYKCTSFYEPSAERILRWDDPLVGIKWHQAENLTIAKKDQDGLLLRELTGM